MGVVLIRSLILYIVVIFGVRLMGKRQLGELQPSELVITILISNIATLPLEDPDIPLFIAMVLKSVYEIALSYGYSYDTDEEKIFILKVIEAAMCDEEAFREKNEALNEDIHQITLAGDRMPEGSWKVSKAEQMRATSACLSQEMIYTKFLQGQFVIGIAGGIFDPIYVNRISDYAVLKYRRRFLESKKADFTG